MKKRMLVSITFATAALLVLSGCGQTSSVSGEVNTPPQTQSHTSATRTGQSSETNQTNQNGDTKTDTDQGTNTHSAPTTVPSHPSSTQTPAPAPAPQPAPSGQAQGVQIKVSTPVPNSGPYYPGQAITFQGKVTGTTAGQKVTVTLYGGDQPPQNMVTSYPINVGADGTFQGTYQVPGKLYTYQGMKTKGQFTMTFEYPNMATVAIPLKFITTDMQ